MASTATKTRLTAEDVWNLPEDERDRQSKRNFYRIIDRFGGRRDLLVSERAGRSSATGKG